MSNTIKINEESICKYDSGNKSKSDFHNVTIRFKRADWEVLMTLK